MGREVRCRCHWNSDARQVTALLESREIILRGELRRHIPLSAITQVRVDEAGLRFSVDADQVVLELCISEAVSWAKKITTPAPTLRDKLGISVEAKALVLGRVRERVLKDALRDLHTRVPSDARMIVAVVQDEQGLSMAAKAYQSLPPKSWIWVIHGKGKAAEFGEAKIREGMRARGFIDTKVSAVSDTLTATRYSKKN